MFLIRILLFPFALIYDFVTRIRNRMYDLRLTPSVGFDIPVICVGNLSVGGTGKTPVIEYLIRLLADHNQLAVLSRGYKRKTKGFRLATPSDSASTLGDEPFQLYTKYGDRITVSVGEDRALAIPSIIQAEEDVEVILLDDGFQHRRVRPGFSILLTDFNKPFYHDFLLPMGRLRESRVNVNRADVIIVTKCPSDMDINFINEIEASIRKYTAKPVFYSSIAYGAPISFGDPLAIISNSVLLVTGIANAEPLIAFVKSEYTLIEHLDFSDHYDYSLNDIQKFESIIKKNPGFSILTTEKDMVKLVDPRFMEMISGLPLFYIPIEVKFMKDGKEFDNLVLQFVSK